MLGSALAAVRSWLHTLFGAKCGVIYTGKGREKCIFVKWELRGEWDLSRHPGPQGVSTEGAQAGGEGLQHSPGMEQDLDRLLESLPPAGRLISVLFFPLLPHPPSFCLSMREEGGQGLCSSRAGSLQGGGNTRESWKGFLGLG